MFVWIWLLQQCVCKPWKPPRERCITGFHAQTHFSQLSTHTLCVLYKSNVCVTVYFVGSPAKINALSLHQIIGVRPRRRSKCARTPPVIRVCVDYYCFMRTLRRLNGSHGLDSRRAHTRNKNTHSMGVYFAEVDGLLADALSLCLILVHTRTNEL